jgi:hypothetical protein
MTKVPNTRLVKKPRESLTTIGVLPSAIVVVGARDRLVAGLLAADDLDQPHLVHRREEVQADEALRSGAGGGQAADRQRRGVAREHAVRGQQRLGLARHLGLQRPVLEHRLDDQLAAVEGAGLDRGRDQAEQLRLGS